jgi:hypothetical protein
LTLDSRSFSLAIKLRLDLPPSNNLPSSCTCGTSTHSLSLPHLPQDCQACHYFQA